MAHIYYALESTEEFVGNFFASEEFRNFLDTKKYDSSKSFLDRFVQLIQNLLKSLGLSKQNEEIMEDILGLMMEDQKALMDVADPGWHFSLDDSQIDVRRVDQLLPRTKGQFVYEGITFNSITHAVAGMEAYWRLQSTPENQVAEQELLVAKILRSTDAREARELTRQLTGDRTEWTNIRHNTTLNIIRAKYDQVPEFRDMLNNTGNRQLIYNSEEYAQMLMIVRGDQEYKKRLQQLGNIQKDPILQTGSYIQYGNGKGFVLETGDTMTKLLGGESIPTTNIKVLGKYNTVTTDKTYFFIGGSIISEAMEEIVNPEEVTEIIDSYDTNNTFFNNVNSILEEIDRC